MNRGAVDRIAAAVLYEGYALYPYRRTSVKNRQRWTFGSVYPVAWCERAGAGDPSSLTTECLVRAEPDASIECSLRFLHLCDRGESGPDVWHEGREREFVTPRSLVAALCDEAATTRFETHEETFDGRRHRALSIAIRLSAKRERDAIYRLTLGVTNDTPFLADESVDRHAGRNDALLHTLASCHAVLGITGGKFLSMQNPAESVATFARTCRSEGWWPVLIGSEHESDTLLATPIIVSDDPQIAPESPGDLFDATEIDEILSLRILTMTDEEKREMRELDPRTRALLERTERLTADDLLALHGAKRGEQTRFASGDRARVRPREGADVLDLALAGRVATVVTIERDAEGVTYATVVFDDDPGRDLGIDGQPGHRFFFRVDELERLS